jgi:hypothetical protein
VSEPTGPTVTVRDEFVLDVDGVVASADIGRKEKARNVAPRMASAVL